MKLLKYLVAYKFFPDYCPKVTNWRNKMKGIDGNGKPIGFDERDQREIRAAIRRMAGSPEK